MSNVIQLGEGADIRHHCVLVDVRSGTHVDYRRCLINSYSVACQFGVTREG